MAFDLSMLQGLLDPNQTSAFANMLAAKAAPPNLSAAAANLTDPNSAFNQGVQNNTGFMLTNPDQSPLAPAPFTPTTNLSEAQMANLTGPVGGAPMTPALAPGESTGYPATKEVQPTPGLTAAQMQALQAQGKAPQQQTLGAPGLPAPRQISPMTQLAAGVHPAMQRPTLSQLIYGR